MFTGGKKKFVRLAAVLVAGSLVAGACTGSATIGETTAQPAATEAAAAPTPQPAEPTAVPETESPESAAPTAVPEPATATEPPSSDAVLIDFRTDTTVGLSGDGQFAYAATSVAWDDYSECVAAPRESLAVVNIVQAQSGTAVSVGAGLEQAGDVRQLVPGKNDQMVVVSSCGSPENASVWAQLVLVGADGRFEQVGPQVALTQDETESSPFVVGFVDDSTIEAAVIVEVDPDDVESWMFERRHVSVATGESTTVEQMSYFDADFGNQLGLVSDQGFRYSVVEDPGGAPGCEGYGIARTIAVDTGDGERFALGVDGPVFSDVRDIHQQGDYVAWSSGCEGFTTAYVGKILADGSIADAHFISTFDEPGFDFVDYQQYRLTPDGYLAAVGATFGPDSSQAPEPGFLRYDLSADPSFVNTADPPVDIDVDPILTAVDGTSGWHLGETLNTARACGGRTLYGKTSTGFVRAFPASVEIDAFVDVDVAEIQRNNYDTGEFLTRTVVFSSACPGDYEGNRVWFGTESDTVQWGLSLDRADMDDVREVLSVRDQLSENTGFVEKSFVQVELFDGTVTEIELVPRPAA